MIYEFLQHTKWMPLIVCQPFTPQPLPVWFSPTTFHWNHFVRSYQWCAFHNYLLKYPSYPEHLKYPGNSLISFLSSLSPSWDFLPQNHKTGIEDSSRSHPWLSSCAYLSEHLSSSFLFIIFPNDFNNYANELKIISLTSLL